MSEQANNTPPPESVARGYEDTRLKPKWLGLFVLGIIAFAVLSHVALWYTMKSFGNNPRIVDRPRTGVSSLSEEPIDRAPPLQPSQSHDRDSSQDLAALRQSEDRVFAQLGWSRDAESGAFVPPASVVQAIIARAASRPATMQAGGTQ